MRALFRGKRVARWLRASVGAFVLVAMTNAQFTRSATLRVPEQFATIQEAIDKADEGDTVVVSPGTYPETVRIAGKSILLCSEFHQSRDPKLVESTVISGEIAEDDDNEGRREQVVLVESDAGRETRICGFTIRGGDDGIACHAAITISHNRFVDNVDAIDYEGGGGVCEHNLFERNEDDAIDLDGDCAITIEHNRMVNNLDDGIEIRLHPYDGDILEVVIRDNVIAGNAEDGIQIIDYPGTTRRHIRIEHNLIVRNSMAGVGCMSNANTREDYQAASIPERIELVNNTLADNAFGVCGGGNMQLVDNIFLKHQHAAIKTSAINEDPTAQNLFWSNGTDIQRVGNLLRAE